MSSFRPTLISLFMVICLLVNIGHATDLQQAQSTMDRYLSAQSHWQDNLAALLIKNKPEFTTTANAQRNQRLRTLGTSAAARYHRTNVL